GHDSPVTTLVVSPDGRLVATASTDSTIILWDARDACISQEWFTRHGEVWCLAFSPDGRRLASAGEDGKVAIWDISGSSHQVAVLEGHPATVFGCAWSSDGAYMASREGSGATRVWDGRTCRPRLFDGANYKYTNVEPLFSPDGRWLLAHNWSGCGVWDVGSGAHLALQFNDDGDHGASAAAFSPENAYVAVGYNSGTIRIWDMATRQAHLHLNAHTYRIHDVAFSPDGRLLLSVSNDKTVKIWDAHTGAMVQSLEGHEKLVWKACFSPCGKYVGSASGDKTVRVWRTSDGSCLATLPDHGDKVRHVAFTSDGTMLWSAADNGTVL
ncbi:WD40 repeat-like protein, partial [Dichomitus squalens LYAD-421 SS1]